MISLDSWWWPDQPARVPKAAAAGLVAALGAALFIVSAIVLKTGMLGWDRSLFRLLNQVPAAAASVLTPLSHLFLPAGIIAVVALAAVYVVARNRSVMPVAAGAAAAGLAWALVHVAFLPRVLAGVAIAYAVLVGWSRVYLGVHYPLDVLAGAGIGMAAGGVILLALGTLLRRAGRAANLQDTAAGRGPPGSAPGPTAGHQQPKRPEPR